MALYRFDNLTYTVDMLMIILGRRRRRSAPLSPPPVTLDLKLAEKYFNSAMISDGDGDCLPKVFCDLAATKKTSKQLNGIEKAVKTLAKQV